MGQKMGFLFLFSLFFFSVTVEKIIYIVTQKVYKFYFVCAFFLGEAELTFCFSTLLYRGR